MAAAFHDPSVILLETPAATPASPTSPDLKSADELIHLLTNESKAATERARLARKLITTTSTALLAIRKGESVTEYPTKDTVTANLIWTAISVIGFSIDSANKVDKVDKDNILDLFKNLKPDTVENFWKFDEVSSKECSSSVSDPAPKDQQDIDLAIATGKTMVLSQLPYLFKSSEINERAKEYQIPLHHFEALPGDFKRHLENYKSKSYREETLKLNSNLISSPFILVEKLVKEALQSTTKETKATKLLELLNTSEHKNAIAWFLLFAKNPYWELINPGFGYFSEHEKMQRLDELNNPIFNAYKVAKKRDQEGIIASLIKSAKDPAKYASLRLENDPDVLIRFIASFADLDDILQICTLEAKISATKPLTTYLLKNYQNNPLCLKKKKLIRFQKTIDDLIAQLSDLTANEKNSDLVKLLNLSYSNISDVIIRMGDNLLNGSKFDKLIAVIHYIPNLMTNYLSGNDYPPGLPLIEICKEKNCEELFAILSYADELLSQYKQAAVDAKLAYQEGNASKALIKAFIITIFKSPENPETYFDFSLVSDLLITTNNDAEFVKTINQTLANPQYAKKFLETIDGTKDLSSAPIIAAMKIALNTLHNELEASKPTTLGGAAGAASKKFTEKYNQLVQLISGQLLSTNITKDIIHEINLKIIQSGRYFLYGILNKIPKDAKTIDKFDLAIVELIKAINDTKYAEYPDPTIANFLLPLLIKNTQNQEIIDAICELFKRISAINFSELYTTINELGDSPKKNQLLIAFFSNINIFHQHLKKNGKAKISFDERERVLDTVLNNWEIQTILKGDDSFERTQDILLDVVLPTITTDIQLFDNSDRQKKYSRYEKLLSILEKITPLILQASSNDPLQYSLCSIIRSGIDKLCLDDKLANRSLKLAILVATNDDKNLNPDDFTGIFTYNFQTFLEWPSSTLTMIKNDLISLYLICKDEITTLRTLTIAFQTAAKLPEKASQEKPDGLTKSSFIHQFLTCLSMQIARHDFRLAACMQLDKKNEKEQLANFLKEAGRDPENKRSLDEILAAIRSGENGAASPAVAPAATVVTAAAAAPAAPIAKSAEPARTTDAPVAKHAETPAIPAVTAAAASSVVAITSSTPAATPSPAKTTEATSSVPAKPALPVAVSAEKAASSSLNEQLAKAFAKGKEALHATSSAAAPTATAAATPAGITAAKSPSPTSASGTGSPNGSTAQSPVLPEPVASKSEATTAATTSSFAAISVSLSTAAATTAPAIAVTQPEETGTAASASTAAAVPATTETAAPPPPPPLPPAASVPSAATAAATSATAAATTPATSSAAASVDLTAALKNHGKFDALRQASAAESDDDGKPKEAAADWEVTDKANLFAKPVEKNEDIYLYQIGSKAPSLEKGIETTPMLAKLIIKKTDDGNFTLYVTKEINPGDKSMSYREVQPSEKLYSLVQPIFGNFPASAEEKKKLIFSPDETPNPKLVKIKDEATYRNILDELKNLLRPKAEAGAAAADGSTDPKPQPGAP